MPARQAELKPMQGRQLPVEREAWEPWAEPLRMAAAETTEQPEKQIREGEESHFPEPRAAGEWKESTVASGAWGFQAPRPAASIHQEGREGAERQGIRQEQERVLAAG